MSRKFAKISTLINFQIWFPKSNFKNPKYIKNVLVHSLRTPALAISTAKKWFVTSRFPQRYMILIGKYNRQSLHTQPKLGPRQIMTN